MKSHFLFSDDIVYLNHGSFGACPKVVFEDYQKWQLMLEKESVQFMTKTGIQALKNSREALGEFINCEANDLVFIPNPTTAYNTVIKSLKFEKGDEVLSTNLEYGALDRTWEMYCKKSGAKYIRQTISLPIKDKEHFLEMFWAGYTDKTKAIYISQVTSSTALILPVKEIVNKAKELGLMTIIDGAHVPGHIHLDIEELDPDFYTGAVHKWLLSPKGCSFLYVKRELQERIEPLIVSWGYEAEFPSESQFIDWHEYNGTRDYSAHLTVPKLLQFRKDLNWEHETDKCKDLILKWYPKLCELVGSEPICPLSKEFLGQMCSVPIKTTQPIELKETLYNRFKIEIPVTNVGKDYFIRLSVQPYTTEEEIDVLYNALKVLKQEGTLLN